MSVMLTIVVVVVVLLVTNSLSSTSRRRRSNISQCLWCYRHDWVIARVLVCLAI